VNNATLRPFAKAAVRGTHRNPVTDRPDPWTARMPPPPRVRSATAGRSEAAGRSATAGRSEAAGRSATAGRSEAAAQSATVAPPPRPGPAARARRPRRRCAATSGPSPHSSQAWAGSSAAREGRDPGQDQRDESRRDRGGLVAGPHGGGDGGRGRDHHGDRGGGDAGVRASGAASSRDPNRRRIRRVRRAPGRAAPRAPAHRPAGTVDPWQAEVGTAGRRRAAATEGFPAHHAAVPRRTAPARAVGSGWGADSDRAGEIWVSNRWVSRRHGGHRGSPARCP
jgi:hypothetical protein